MSVRSHYNAKPQQSYSERRQSPAYLLRLANNRLKRHLISSLSVYPPSPRLHVLDIGCGNGGDLQKWAFVAQQRKGVEYVGIDVSDRSIRHALERYQQMEASMESHEFHARFRVYNTLEPIPELVSQSFDLISAQFVMNYLCADRRCLDTVLGTVARCLKEGGFFFGVVLDGKALHTQSNGKNMENDLVSITWTSPVSYRFSLVDCVFACEEYVLEETTFQKALERHGFTLEVWENGYIHWDHYVRGTMPNLPAEEMAVLSLYAVFIAEKKKKKEEKA